MENALYELSKKDINILGFTYLQGQPVVMFEYRRRLGGNDRWNKAAASCVGQTPDAWIRGVISLVDNTRELINRG